MSGEALAPRVYRENRNGFLPAYLFRRGNCLCVAGENGEKEKGPYDWVVDFGYSRDGYRVSVPLDERIIANSLCRPNMRFLGFTFPKVRMAMRQITDLANTGSPRIPEDKEKYCRSLAKVYHALAEEVGEIVGKERALLLPPKNGGIFVAQEYQKYGFPHEDIYDFHLSRIPKDGNLLVGVGVGEENPSIANYRTFVVGDDCIATDVSAFTTMLMIREGLAKEKIPFSEVRVVIAVSAATQRGMESLTSPETKEYFGFRSITAIAAVPVYSLNDHFYLTEDDGRYTAGDMGDWTEPIPAV